MTRLLNTIMIDLTIQVLYLVTFPMVEINQKLFNTPYIEKCVALIQCGLGTPSAIGIALFHNRHQPIWSATAN